MTQRELLPWGIDAARLALLRVRVAVGRPLPAALMAALVSLDRWSARLELRQRERAVGRPFDAEASRRIDRALTRRQFFPVTVRGLLRLDRKAGEETILRLAEQIKPLLIILDPIGPLHGWDENSADEMGRLLNILLGFYAKTGAAVLFWRLRKAIDALEKSGDLHRDKRGMPARGYVVKGPRQ